MLVAAASTPSTADPTWKLKATDSSYSYVCKGEDSIAITGDRNSLTVTGECGALEVSGSGNQVTIESVGAIRISGNNNDVRYERALNGKPRPTSKVKGAANSVRRGG